MELPADADGHYQLTLAPDRTYLAWLEEEGADVAVSSDGGASWVDSAPWRWADEPLLLTSDISGVVGFDIRGMRQGRPHVFGLRLQCQAGTSEREQQFWSDARQLSALRTALDEKWHFLDGMRALLLGMRALHLYAATDDQRAWVQFQLAALVRQRGLLREAADLYQQAATSSEKAQRPKWYSSALYRRGQALYAGGATDIGALFLEAAEVSRQEGQAYQSASARQDYCLILRANGDATAASDCLRDRVHDFQQLNEPIDQCVTLRNLATALLVQGRYEEARAALGQASNIAKALDDPREIAGVRILQSHLDAWAGKFEQALRGLEEARELRLASGGPLEVANVDSMIADVYLQSGQPILARSYLKHAIDDFERYGAQGWLGEALVAMSQSYSIEQKFDLALEYAGKAVATYAGQGIVTRRSRALIELARLQVQVGKRNAARETLKVLHRLRKELPWGDLTDVALIERSLTTAPQSLKADTLLLELVKEAFDRGQVIRFLNLASELATNLQMEGQEAEIQEQLDKAERIGKQVAARLGSPYLRNSLLHRLQPIALKRLFEIEDGQTLQTSTVEKLLARVEELRSIDREPAGNRDANDALTELERVLSDELLSRTSTGISAERRRLLLESLGDGGTAPLSAPEPLDLSLVALPDAVTYYFVVEERRAGYLIWNGDSWHWHVILDVGAMKDDIIALSTLLQAGHGDRSELEVLSQKLSSRFGLQDLSSHTPSILYVVTDPTLFQVPWSMLPVGSSLTPLGATTSVVELQSLERFDPADVRELRLLGSNPPNDSPLESLPEMESELTEVGRLWPKIIHQSSPEATPVELVDALSNSHAMVHVAAHGRGDGGQPEESGLWLRSPETGPAFVSAMRLRDMPLKAPLVVLSACESGQSSAGLSLGAGGVAGSLVDAGVGRVVGSRWTVSDRTARQFAEAFHAALAESGGDASNAVRQAVAVLRTSPATKHPRHWAGWFLLQSGPERERIDAKER